jgi:hypothetical protein
LIDYKVLDGRHLHRHVVLVRHEELRQLHFHENVIVLQLVDAQVLRRGNLARLLTLVSVIVVPGEHTEDVLQQLVSLREAFLGLLIRAQLLT